MKLTPWHFICLCIAVGMGCLAGWISKEKYPVAQPGNESATVYEDSFPVRDAFKHAPAALPRVEEPAPSAYSVQPPKPDTPKPQPAAAPSIKEDPVPYTATQLPQTDMPEPQQWPQPSTLPFSFPSEGPAQPEEMDLPTVTLEDDIKTDVNLHTEFYGTNRHNPESEPFVAVEDPLEQTDANL